MSDLLWPGDHRAEAVFSDAAVLTAMVRVEAAWLAALAAAGVAPDDSKDDLSGLLGDSDLERVAVDGEAGGNPVIPMLTLLRERVAQRNTETARWLHVGLTSQDVLDTALVLCSQAAAARVLQELDRQSDVLAALADRHRGTVAAGRTLTQHAVPVTFGLKVAQWLQGVLDARDDLRRSSDALPAQIGGAAGTLAATTELLRLTGVAPPADAAMTLAGDTAARLGLRAAAPWHTVRTPLTRYADALVTATDAWGHIAGDVLLLNRPEIAELAEPAVAGRGGSSTMPQKANPVLSVLVRRAALAAPGLAAQLHLAAATSVDERPDGAWHTEWTALAGLSRRAVVAGSQTTELLEGLHVDTGRMAALVRSSASALLAERRSVAARFAGEDSNHAPDFDPAHYLGAADRLVDDLVARARSTRRPS